MMSSNHEMMKKRLRSQGGHQEGRMIKDKYRAFDQALLYSYQSAWVKKVGDEDACRALINPDKAKADYDDKILSIDNAHSYRCGDVFEWVGTNTHWIIYVEQITEDAYFRAEIRRCKYQIEWANLEKKVKETTWAYIRGPVETKINAIQKSGISVDVPNYSLHIYVPNNEVNRAKFTRYSKFLLDDIAWEVSVVDKISVDGVIEIVAVENYINTVTDSKDDNLVDAFIVRPVIPETGTDKFIEGKEVITPTLAETYHCPLLSGGAWSIKEPKRPVTLTVLENNSVSLIWTELLSGQFTLQYITSDCAYEQVIVVESLM